jgi:hypothetical protein
MVMCSIYFTVIKKTGLIQKTKISATISVVLSKVLAGYRSLALGTNQHKKKKVSVLQNESKTSPNTKIYLLIMVLIEVIIYLECELLVICDFKPGSVERSRDL